MMMSALLISNVYAQQDDSSEEVIVGTVTKIEAGYIQEPLPYHPATPGLAISVITAMFINSNPLTRIAIGIGAGIVGGAITNHIAMEALKKDAYRVTIETKPNEYIEVLQAKLNDIMIGDPVSVVGYDTETVKLSRLNF